MKSGIKSIDSTLGHFEFPTEGVVAIIGNSELNQRSLAKEILRNIAVNFKSSMVVTHNFYFWATRDFAEELPTVGIVETNTDDICRLLKEISSASNFDDYPLTVVDSIPAAGTMFEVASCKKLLDKNKNRLMIVNCNESGMLGKFDLRNLLVSMSRLTLKVEEKTSSNGVNIQLSMFGPYLQEIKKSTIVETNHKEEAS